MEQKQQVLFFSRMANLVINTGPGERVIENGQSKVIPAPIIEFSPMGQEHWGQLMTDDPFVIDFLNKRIERAKAAQCKSDVLTLSEWTLETTPADVRAQKAEGDYQRVLTEKNELSEIVARLQQRVEELEASKKKA